MAEVAALSAIASAASAAAAAGGTIYSASQAKKSRPAAGPAPTPQAVVRPPDENDPRVREERERRIRERNAAGGRESTNLSNSGDYSGTVLGG